MKKLISYLLYSSILMLFISLGACQKEFEDLPEQNNSEAIKASSNTAQLIKSASSNDGSYDNIVDGASCFSINFPYVVNINGLNVNVNAVSTLELVQDLLTDGEDDLEIQFPITVTLADFTEMTLNDEDELEDLVEACQVLEDDDDIECVSFVYPIKVYSFDIAFQQTGSVTLESDMQLRRYFDDLDDDALVSFQFPISLKLYNDIEHTVNDNAELVDIIESVKDNCDDDDNDFTQEELSDYLVGCPWLIEEVVTNGTNQTNQYLESLMKFQADGTVTVNNSVGNTVNGTWNTVKVGSKVKLRLNFNELSGISLEWFVYDIDDEMLKLIAKDGNKIILKEGCDFVNNDPEVLRNVLQECSWAINKVTVDDEVLKRLLGYEFTFLANGEVTLVNGADIKNGTWEVANNTQGRLVMSIEITDEPDVSFDWLLSDLEDNNLEFSMGDDDYELVLEKICVDNIADVDAVEIRDILKTGKWEVTKYLDDGDDETEDYANFDFTFSSLALVTVSANSLPVHLGIWKVIKSSDGQLKCYLNFGVIGSLEELTNNWRVISSTANRLELRDKDDDGGTNTLIFERK
ncbi:hypothetical protein [Arenibacter latericius]|uniref:hypothetical protein n=1 Tax=Arenibacter latericius TaxID=86104 RepID=UPI00047C687F|nr:hypothetical protein [Arenibacter latericius]